MNTVAQLSAKITTKASLSDVQASYDDIVDEANFMEDYVVIVSDDGTGRYHKYGCTHLDLSYFWAYNTEAARSQGYYACPYCCG